MHIIIGNTEYDRKSNHKNTLCCRKIVCMIVFLVIASLYWDIKSLQKLLSLD